VLDNVDPQMINQVMTDDDAIFDKAQALRVSGLYTHDAAAPVGLSVHFPLLFNARAIANYEHIYNIHPGYLPWGRCYYPVFWALWNDEPAGCTLHEIDAGIDTGPIVAQCSVPKYDWDTGGTLHQRVSDAEKGLFLEFWPCIVDGDMLEAVPQVGAGSFHLQAEFLELKASGAAAFMFGEPDSAMQGFMTYRLLRLIRCLSHPDYTGMLVNAGGKQYEVSMRPVE